MGSHSPGNT